MQVLTAAAIQLELDQLGDPADAIHLQRFFKTGPGQYGAGDLFRGIRVPVLRRLIKVYQHIPLTEAEQLLHSPYHEDRLLTLLILARQYARSEAVIRQEIYDLYLGNTRFINNWDLVDLSAEHIVGTHLEHQKKDTLYNLAQSGSIWERRIAVLATFRYIKRKQYETTLDMARLLLHDQADLIHKAVGWMLREVGKRNLATEVAFLKNHYAQMPRTMLRYAIEKFPEPERQRYLRGEV